MRHLESYLGYLGIRELYDFTNKERNSLDYITYMINRCQAMFRYENLPPDIPARDLELMLQCNGFVIFTDKPDGKYRIFIGGLGGEPDYLYRPTLATIANPALKYSANLKIGDECIIIPNDTMFMGLIPMHKRYSSMLVENDISLRLNNVNSRVASIISAQDDRTVQSAQKYLEQIDDGDIGIVAETAFLDGVRTNPYSDNSTSNNIISLMEYQQFLKASWLNDLGLDASSNLKREYVNESELSLNGDMQLSFMDDMLRNRLRALDEINEKYGLDIKCYLNSAWEDNQNIIDNITEGIDTDMDGAINDEEIKTEAKEVEKESNVEETNEEIITEPVQETRAEEVMEEVEKENITEDEVEEIQEENEKSEEKEEDGDENEN